MADENSTDVTVETPDYTTFEEVYRVFLGTIDSYYLSQMEDDELKENLFGYLDNALLNFSTYISKDFSDLNEEEGHFNVKLTRLEISLLAKGMKLEWVRRSKHSEELMQKAIGDRDYQAVQGYQYLDRLRDVDRDLEKEIRTLINRIEYSDSSLYGDMA